MTDLRTPGTAPQLEMSHVLFIDVVAYSTLPMDQQQMLLAGLQELVRSTPQFVRSQASDHLIRLPTGDGMALVFFGDPEAPARCALELSRALRDHPDIRVRMGIHSGPVYRVADINANRNVSGGGINIAQRVMDCGDAGHILVSGSVAEVLSQLSNWKSLLQDLGVATVKHGARVHLFNLWAENAGNREIPRKLRFDAIRRRWLMLAGSATTLVIVITAVAFLNTRKVHALRDTDTLVLADFTNTTGDSVFDGALRQGLAAQLGQSPFLNILADQKVRKELKLMGRSRTDRLTPDVVRDLCLREGSKAYIEGSIASLGSQFVIGLEAINCQTGDSLAREQETAPSKERVLNALDKASARLREKLGESLSSVRKFDTPLAEATTSSLEALEAYSLGTSERQLNDANALPSLKRAVELDPDFASAYEALGVCYLNLGEVGLGRENFTKAFNLRDRVSEREKFVIAARYYHYVTGDLHKAIETYQVWTQTYPRSAAALANLSTLYASTGRFELAIPGSLEAIRLEPDAGAHYSNLILSYAALDRFDDARKIYNLAISRKILDPTLGVNWFGVSFVLGDRAEMDRLMAGSAGQPEAEDSFLAAKSDTEAFFGRLKQAREFSREAVASALRSDQKETAVQWKLDEVLTEAEFGNHELARRESASGLALSSNHDSQILAALAFARTGDPAKAQSIANELARSYPLDTLVNEYWLPVIRAAIEITRNNPEKALEFIGTAIPYELASPQTWSGLGGPLYPAYLRGQALLMLRRGTDAAKEYQKLVDHRGFMLASPLRVLAHLGLARAFELDSDMSRSRSAYQDFFELWSDADPGIPLLKQARLEYAKLK
ncbi:MAG: tetratricopeptide repeat protein [Candidatus Acidiferrales bacterium]